MWPDLRTYTSSTGPKLWRAVFLYAGDREIANDGFRAGAQERRRPQIARALGMADGVSNRWGRAIETKARGDRPDGPWIRDRRRNDRAAPGASPAHPEAAGRDRPALLRGVT